MYPQQVEISEDKIIRLRSIYKYAYKKIYDEINGATDFGVSNRRTILKQIENILKRLGVDISKFLQEEIPNYYKEGANDLVKQLNNIGADVAFSTGFNRIHEEAISMLVDDTSKAFLETMSGVNRSARNLLGKAVREQLTMRMAKGFIAGEAMRDSVRAIKSTLQQQGLSALVDKGGKRWTLERYAEMLFRTKAVEARNRGMANRMVENGYDLVQVSEHGDSCPLCTPWQGKILSLTGNTAGYPTVASAEASGLFHPNCRHAINVLIPSLARLTKAYNTKTGQYEVGLIDN
jgi:Phage minor capsid protein 2